jgi:hypothetical protein
MKSVKITTESGSVYDIGDNGVCRKFDARGVGVDAFKVFYMKAVPEDVQTMKEINKLPNSKPEVGKLLYIGGLKGWWLSTKIVRIEY